MRNVPEGSGDLSLPGQQGWLIGTLRKVVWQLRSVLLIQSNSLCFPQTPASHRQRSLNGWFSGMRRSCVEDMGPSRSWKFSVAWNLYRGPHAEVQECVRAELTTGPMPERGDMRRRSDAIMSENFSLLS